MKRYSHAIQNLRQRLGELTAEKRETQAEILRLKSVPGTGAERSRLHSGYNDLFRPKARAAHLANGLLRGVPYSAMEAKCWESPPVYGVYETLQKAFGEEDELKAEWPLERVCSLLKPTAEVQGAAA